MIGPSRCRDVRSSGRLCARAGADPAGGAACSVGCCGCRVPRPEPTRDRPLLDPCRDPGRRRRSSGCTAVHRDSCWGLARLLLSFHMVSHGVLPPWSRWFMYRNGRRCADGLGLRLQLCENPLPFCRFCRFWWCYSSSRTTSQWWSLARWCGARSEYKSPRRGGWPIPVASPRRASAYGVRRRAGRCDRRAASAGCTTSPSARQLPGGDQHPGTDGPGDDVRDPPPRAAPELKKRSGAQRNSRLVCDNMLDRHANKHDRHRSSGKWRPSGRSTGLGRQYTLHGRRGQGGANTA